MIPYYNDTELLLIFKNCTSILQVQRASVLIASLYNDREIINLRLVNKLSHLKIRELIKCT